MRLSYLFCLGRRDGLIDEYGSSKETISSPSTADVNDGTARKLNLLYHWKDQKEKEDKVHETNYNPHEPRIVSIPDTVSYPTSPCASVILEELMSGIFCFLSSSS